MNYLEKDEESGKYSLGIGVFELCQSAGDRFSIRNIVMPFMQEIADTTGEMVYLAAVSYTHLDVYKRQIKVSGSCRIQGSWWWNSGIPFWKPSA